MQKLEEATTMTTVAKFGLLASCLVFAGAMLARGQEHAGHSPSLAQVVALDECDPATFNAALGADFCKNVALGSFTTNPPRQSYRDNGPIER
jgi:hypothetical protein